jgi:sodium-dependent phosphate transporter
MLLPCILHSRLQVCALIGSSTWLMLATRMGWPVSTTHSIIGAVLGVGVAAFGSDAVNWEYGSGRGFAGIVASWFISIAIAGLMAGITFLVMRFAILRYKNSFQRSLIFGPIMFGFVYGIIALALVWKGAPKLKLDNIPDSEVITIVLVTWAVTTVLSYLFVSVPLYRYHWQGQDLQWYDYILGPLAPTRPTRATFDNSHLIEIAAAGGDDKISLFKGLFNTELDEKFLASEQEARNLARIAAEEAAASKKTASDSNADAESESASVESVEEGKADVASQKIANLEKQLAVYEAKMNTPRKKYEREWKKQYDEATLGRKAFLLARYYIMFGIDGRDLSDENGDHLKFAPRYLSKTEDFYRSLNVITSCVQAFSHGSNDVANAIGPLSTIYYIWANNKIPGSRSPVEVWQLAFGAAGIVLGLALYGYNIMKALGNNLTYQSPSRGFCMDLGSAITILIASKEGFPISTTQAITGATVGAGLANGDAKAVNWWLFLRIFIGWAVTLPVAGTVSGLIYAFVAFSPTQAHDPASV